MTKKKNTGQIRECTIPLETVLKAESTPYDKKWTRIPSLDCFIDTDSFDLWRQKGVGCVICGIAGMYFAKERTPGQGSMFNRWHLNLYAVDGRGFEVQMTKDHILAKAQGGDAYGVNNLQPMCYPHNQKKAHQFMDEFMLKVKQNEGIEGEVWDETLQKPVIQRSPAVVKAEEEWNRRVQICLDEIKKYYGLDVQKMDLVQAAAAGFKVKQESSQVHLLECVIKENTVYVLYDNSRATPFRAYPPVENIAQLHDSLPSWAKTRPDSATLLAEYKQMLQTCTDLAAKAASMSNDEAAKFLRSQPYSTVSFAILHNRGKHHPSLNAWNELMKKYRPKPSKPWQPVFYWTGELKKDAELINKPHIAEEGVKEDRTEETYDLIQTCIDCTRFDLNDALNLQSRLLSLNNWKGIEKGLRKHPVNFKDAAKWEDVEKLTAKIFPVHMADTDVLLKWYRSAAVIHPFSDLNGRVLGIIVAVLNYNYRKSIRKKTTPAS